MYRFGDDFLAGSGFARNEYRTALRGDQLDDVADLHHRAALADYVLAPRKILFVKLSHSLPISERIARNFIVGFIRDRLYLKFRYKHLRFKPLNSDFYRRPRLGRRTLC